MFPPTYISCDYWCCVTFVPLCVTPGISRRTHPERECCISYFIISRSVPGPAWQYTGTRTNIILHVVYGLLSTNTSTHWCFQRMYIRMYSYTTTCWRERRVCVTQVRRYHLWQQSPQPRSCFKYISDFKRRWTHFTGINQWNHAYFRAEWHLFYGYTYIYAGNKMEGNRTTTYNRQYVPDGSYVIRYCGRNTHPVLQWVYPMDAAIDACFLCHWRKAWTSRKRSQWGSASGFRNQATTGLIESFGKKKWKQNKNAQGAVLMVGTPRIWKFV